MPGIEAIIPCLSLCPILQQNRRRWITGQIIGVDGGVSLMDTELPLELQTLRDPYGWLSRLVVCSVTLACGALELFESAMPPAGSLPSLAAGV